MAELLHVYAFSVELFIIVEYAFKTAIKEIYDYMIYPGICLMLYW